MTKEQYLIALRKLAGPADQVQIKEDGHLTPPMTFSAAAEYLYNGTKPAIKTMPSENNQMYSDPDIKRINEQAKARASDLKMRNFYEHGVLPALTFGASELFTNGIPGRLTFSTAVPLFKGVSTRLLWPLALGLGAYSWWNAAHEPYSGSFSVDRSFTTAEPDTTATSSVTAEPDTTAAPSSATPSPQPRSDESTNRKPSFRERLGDRIAGRNSRQTTGGGNNSTPNPKPSRGLAPFTGYKNGTWWGNILRIVRDMQVTGTGLDFMDNAAGKIGERLDTTRVDNSNWNLTRDFTPAGWMFHFSTKERPADNTKTSQTGAASTNTESTVSTNTISTVSTDEDKVWEQWRKQRQIE